MLFRLYELAAASATAVALTAAQLAPAEADLAPPARVHFQGCVKSGVEAGCLTVESGGKIYNVSSAKDRLAVGTYASGSGVPGGASFCMQGTPLSDIVLDKIVASHEPCAQGSKVTTQH